MQSPEQVLRAQQLVGAARDFLSAGAKESPRAWPTLDFYAGVFCALGWVLEAQGNWSFDEHLVMLERIRGRLMQPAGDER